MEEKKKNKRNKIILTISTMVIAVTLIVIGVYAAVSQNVTVGGKITTTIEDSSLNAKMEVTAAIRSTNTDFDQYGHKPSIAKQEVFQVPDITLDEENYYLIHRFEFINYGAPVVSFNLSVDGNPDSNEAFDNNFDYYIGESISPTLKNAAYYEQDFLAAGVDVQTDKRIYVLIRLKEIPRDVGEITALYNITMSYSV